jgi:hypothetical protein
LFIQAQRWPADGESIFQGIPAMPRSTSLAIATPAVSLLMLGLSLGAPAQAANPDLGPSEIPETTSFVADTSAVSGGSSVQAAEDGIARALQFASIQQTGDHNTASINQVGIANQATILQSGHYNSASIVQIGSGNVAFISQSGR